VRQRVEDGIGGLVTEGCEVFGAVHAAALQPNAA
jgi:hypothetical protein